MNKDSDYGADELHVPVPVPTSGDQPGSTIPPVDNPQPPTEESRPLWRELLTILGILAAALVVAFIIVTFVFRSYEVDGPSMETTLQNSDKLIIWKVPRTWARITHHNYIPNRGDIVVFNESGLLQYGDSQDSKQVIKRVLGLPGERVVVSNGTVTIYNKANPDGFQPDQTLPYGKKGMPYTSGNVDVTLRANQLFVCGDNRPDSFDSRIFGPITADQIVGKLALRILPVSKAEVF
jgi:signal peptidase I